MNRSAVRPATEAPAAAHTSDKAAAKSAPKSAPPSGTRAVTRPVKQRSNALRTGEQLLEAAVQIWADEGLAAVTITSVAQRAKRTRRTVYQHFPSREILIESARERLDEQLAKLATGNAGVFDNPYSLVAGLAADDLDLVRTRVSDLLMGDVRNNPFIDDVREMFRGYSRRGVLKDGIDPDHAAMMTISMWFAATMVVSLGDTPDERRQQARAFGNSFADIMARGAFVDGYRAGSHEPPAPPRARRTPAVS